MVQIQIPCTIRNQKIIIEASENDNVSSLRAKIALILKKDPSHIKLFFSNEKLSNDTKISELQLGKEKNSSIQVSLILKPLIKRKVHISSTEEENKIQFLKREMKFIISNSDNVNSVITAQKILDSASDTPISELFSNSIENSYICSYLFNLFKEEIAKSIDSGILNSLFQQCNDLRLLGYILNYLSETNENLVANYFKQLPLGFRLFTLLEHLNFSNKPSIAKKILSKVPKYKNDLAAVAHFLIIFINNLTFEDKNYFTDIFVQTRDLKRSKYKNSPEIRMLILSLAIKCDKVQEILKRYDKLLNTSIEKPNLTKAVLSTVHQLYLLSLNEGNHLIDLQAIRGIINQIPKKYEQEDFIQILIDSHIKDNPDIFKINNNNELTFSDLLEFSYSHNFRLILKSKVVKETFLMNMFSWLANGLNFMKVFKMIYDINSTPDYPSAINSLLLIYSSSCPEICPSTFSINATSLLHHHAHYPSQIIDSIFNLLTLFIDILPKNETVRKLDTRYIFEFSYLFLLRPSLSLQKAALKIIKKIIKYKNNEDLSELMINNNEGRKKRRLSADSNREKDVTIYKSLMDQINNSPYSDFNESCRIIRGALLYFTKSTQSFKDEVFNFASCSGGQNLISKLQCFQEEQLQKSINQKDSDQKNQNQPEKEQEQDKEKEIAKKQKVASKGNKNIANQQKPSSAPQIHTPQSPKSLNSPSNSKENCESGKIDDLSYSFVYLKFLLDRIETNFECYIPFLKSRLEFTSIAFSFISFGGNSPNIRESFLNFLLNTNLINLNEKLDIVFRFVQNVKKLEPKVARQSDSHISIKKYQSTNAPLISNSCNFIVIPGLPRKKRTVVNTNFDSACYEKEMKIIIEITKSLNALNLKSEIFSFENLMYFYIISHISYNKSLTHNFAKLIEQNFDFFSNPRCIIYENIRLYVLSILYSQYDKRAAYLLPQVSTKPAIDFLKHQDSENKKFFYLIFHSFLINDKYYMQKGTCMLLSLKSHSKIDTSISAFSLLKENPKKAIRNLFCLLSSNFISSKMVKKVLKYLNYFLENNYPIDSRSTSFLVGVNENVLESLLDSTTDHITHFLPFFMINNVFSINLWKKIADDYSKDIVNQCIISTFSAYSNYSAYLNSSGENFEDYEKTPTNLKIAYQLFDIYGVEKSKSWQVITLSLLFFERNEFALEHLNDIIDDNDRLTSIKKSPIADHFKNPIESLLNNRDKEEINSAILEILPLVRSKNIYKILFDYIQNEEELDEKEVLESIKEYCSFGHNLTASPDLLAFLLSNIEDENQLTENLRLRIKNFMRNNKESK